MIKFEITPPELVGDKTPESLRTNSRVKAAIFAVIERFNIRFKQKTYIIPSHFFDGYLNRQIQKYLILSNGILKQGSGKAGWITDGQLFSKKHFWLAKDKSYFSLLFYSHYWTQVRHTYYVSSYNDDYFKIEWVSQRQESGLNKPLFVKIPDGYHDNSIPADSNVIENKNVFFIGEMAPGDSIGISLTLPNQTNPSPSH